MIRDINLDRGIKCVEAGFKQTVDSVLLVPLLQDTTEVQQAHIDVTLLSLLLPYALSYTLYALARHERYHLASPDDGQSHP